MKHKELIRHYTTELFFSDEAEQYVAYFLELGRNVNGCGDTGVEAVTNLHEAALSVMAIFEEDGESIPKPYQLHEFTGKFMVRISPEIHRFSTIAAKRLGISLNQYVSDKLAADAGLYPVKDILMKFLAGVEAKHLMELVNDLNECHEASSIISIIADLSSDEAKMLHTLQALLCGHNLRIPSENSRHNKSRDTDEASA